MRITDYQSILPKGRQNAVPSSVLISIMGFRNARELRADIARSRQNGQVILSSQDGYFLACNDEEIRQFVRTMQRKAIGIFCSLKSARKLLNENPAQLNIDDILVHDTESIED